MKFMALAAAAAGVMLVGAPAQAQSVESGLYAGAGYTHYSAEDDVSVGGITGRLGYQVNKYFAVEGEGTFGVMDDTVNVLGTDVDVELDNAWGVYGVGTLPVSERVNLFGRVGWAKVSVEGSAAGVSASAEDDGVGYGVGGTFGLTDRFALRAEYTRLEGDDDAVDTFGIGGQMKF